MSSTSTTVNKNAQLLIAVASIGMVEHHCDDRCREGDKKDERCMLPEEYGLLQMVVDGR